ncbi:sodium-dependent multivitamin transporter-like protein [Dinothrombium tinctorium]|uniref:Sodium-dependent multivitamin transporter-like protein n=1 Tax=Dinothrombium tinctorium TaxID=1965070 RepID=A0A3S3PHE2_9ACAR|nr:sodium-dependent multivitamin transporter-like protein [Dinothrombium tinctorium]RWS09709.1 sodium-dependent multivitamin transporter-like protein [Dinothrombium tinctorium]
MAYFVLADYCVLLGLMFVSLLVGIFFAWKDKEKTNEEYLGAGRKMRVFPVAISLLASFLTSHMFIGWPVEIYSKGTQLAMAFIANFVSTFIAAEVFIPIYYKINAISVNKASENLKS